MKAPRWWTVAALAAALAGCDNMKHQDHARPLDASAVFADGAAARTPPAHTVPHGPDPERPPATVDLALLERGRARFDAACAPCHGADGYGRGIVVRRGFPPPPSLHDPRLRAAPDQEIYTAIVRGYGIMYPAVDRVPADERWAVVAYVRALQLSQHASLADVPEAQRAALRQAP